MVAVGAHLDQEGRSSSQPLTTFQQPSSSSDNWHPPHAQLPSGTSLEEGSGSFLSWQPYPAPPQHQNGPPPYLPAPPLHHMAPQQHPPPPIHPPPPTQAGYGGVPPHSMASMHHHHPWQGHHHMPPPPHMGATFPPTHGIPHAYLVGGCYPPPLPPHGYYPPHTMAYPMYFVAAPPPLPEQQHPALAPPQKQQQRPTNSRCSSSSKYPGKHVRPLREVMVATGHPPPPHHVLNGYQYLPQTRPLPPSELCVPTLLSPLRNKRPRPVVGQPWAVLHDLQEQHAHPVPEAKVAWYSQMNREWHAVLERQNQREGTFERARRGELGYALCFPPQLFYANRAHLPEFVFFFAIP